MYNKNVFDNKLKSVGFLEIDRPIHVHFMHAGIVC